MSNEALTVQLLQWVGEEPRAYTETIEAWRTSCPRLTIWEDALSAGLLQRIAGSRLSEAKIELTPAGRAFVRERAAQG